MRKKYLFVVLALTTSFLFSPGATALDSGTENLDECLYPPGGDDEGDTTNETKENETSGGNESSLLSSVDSKLNETQEALNETEDAAKKAAGSRIECVADEIPSTWNCDRIVGRNACLGTNTERCRIQIIYGLGFCIIF